MFESFSILGLGLFMEFCFPISISISRLDFSQMQFSLKTVMKIPMEIAIISSQVASILSMHVLHQRHD